MGSPGSHGSVLQSARRAIRKRRKLILVTFALILLGDIVGTYAMTPRWLGEARILVMPGPFHGLAPFGAAGRQSNQGEASISTLDVVEMLGSRELALRLVERHRLDEREGPGGLRGAVQAIGEGVVSAPGVVLGAIRGGERVEISPVDIAADELQDLQDISDEQDTSIVNVGVWAESPKLANSLANGLAEALIEKDTAASREEAEQSYQFTVRELARADARLSAARAQLQKFQEGQHFSDPTKDLSATMSRFEQARKALDITQAELAGVGARLEETRAQLAGQPETVTATQVVATNPVVEQLRSDLVKLELQLAGELQYKQEAHPDVQRLRALMKENEGLLHSEIERIVDRETIGLNPIHQQLLLQSLSLDAHRQGLEAQEQVQVAATEATRGDLDALAAKSAEFERLSADVEAADLAASGLRVAAAELDALRHTDIALGGTRLRIIERSEIPDGTPKDMPKWLINLAVGLVAGALLSVVLAFSLDYLREEPAEAGEHP